MKEFTRSGNSDTTSPQRPCDIMDLVHECRERKGSAISISLRDSSSANISFLVSGFPFYVEKIAPEKMSLMRKSIEEFSEDLDINSSIQVTGDFDFFVIQIDIPNSLTGLGFDKVQSLAVKAASGKRRGLTLVSGSSQAVVRSLMRSIYLTCVSPFARCDYLVDDGFFDVSQLDVVFVEVFPGDKVGESKVNKIIDLILSGKQVFLGFVSGSSMMSIQKLLFISRFTLTSKSLASVDFLSSIIHAKPLPCLCPHCKIPVQVVHEHGIDFDFGISYRLNSLVSESIGKKSEHAALDISSIFTANEEGCNHCASGFYGETLCAELVFPDNTILTNFLHSDFSSAFFHWRKTRDSGFVGMRSEDHAIVKMGEGLVDPLSIEGTMENLNYQRFFDSGEFSSDALDEMVSPLSFFEK